MSLHLSFSLVPPSSLSTNNRSSRHWRNRAADTGPVREYATLCCRGYPPMAEPVAIAVHVTWPTSRIMPDVDSIGSYAKPYLDGIVDAGVLSDDGPKVVKRATFSQAKQVGKDGVTGVEFDLTTITEGITP
ncbi:hypothetical protein [Iamia sp.]|uniref:hypothetical protein n=1 Tax=Iamia sp. TaxID=2722710 RepID=UPI002C61677D|nr:hypothetical protein [Iamia sp.]HXH57926.1 hypothetical protein [Iamia sp.]